MPLASTEVSERPGRKFKLGPKLPIGISRHCLIRIGESPIHIKVRKKIIPTTTFGKQRMPTAVLSSPFFDNGL